MRAPGRKKVAPYKASSYGQGVVRRDRREMRIAPLMSDTRGVAYTDERRDIHPE